MKFTFKEIEELLAKRREFSISIQRKLVEEHADLFSDGYIYFYVGGALYHTAWRDIRNASFNEVSSAESESWSIFDYDMIPKGLVQDPAIHAKIDRIYRDAGLPAPFGTPAPAPIPAEVPAAIVEAVKGVVPEPVISLPVPPVAAGETSRGDLLEMV